MSLTFADPRPASDARLRAMAGQLRLADRYTAERLGRDGDGWLFDELADGCVFGELLDAAMLGLPDEQYLRLRAAVRGDGPGRTLSLADALIAKGVV